MKFDPKKHHRRSIRLPYYDYTSVGAYFVTICTHERQCLFGEIVDGEMRLNDVGRMIQWHWQRIPKHFSNVQLDQSTIMPNHVHGIICIFENDESVQTVGAKHSQQDLSSKSKLGRKNASPLHPIRPPDTAGTQHLSLPAIVQNFKSVTARKFNRMRFENNGKLWQRNYYERVIRDEDELHRIREYIMNNPLKWAEDKDNPINQTV